MVKCGVWALSKHWDVHLIRLLPLFCLLSCSLGSLWMISLLVMHMLDIFFLSVCLWLCLVSQSVMNSCGFGLYSILMLYWCICSNILWNICGRLAISFFNSATSSLWSVITFTSCSKQWWWWNYSRQCSMPSTSPCCYSVSLNLSAFCFQSLLATALHCQVLHSLGTPFCASSVPSIIVPFHCIIP